MMKKVIDYPFSKGPGLGKIVGIVVLLVSILVLSSVFHIVPAGHRGVKFNSISGVNPISYGEGLTFKIPVIETFVDMEVRIDKKEYQVSAASKDLQTVTTTVALNFHPEPSAAAEIYRDIGLSYRERIVDPAIQEAVKAVTALFTAEELITKRDEVRQQIHSALVTKLEASRILLTAVSITDFSFSASFNEAIEQKQTAEQLALKAKRDLDRIKIEAEQRVTQARAEAEAQRLLATSITSQVVDLRRIDATQQAIAKWDGRMPQVSGSALPFWDIIQGRGLN